MTFPSQPSDQAVDREAKLVLAQSAVRYGSNQIAGQELLALWAAVSSRLRQLDRNFGRPALAHECPNASALGGEADMSPIDCDVPDPTQPEHRNPLSQFEPSRGRLALRGPRR
jgi:hypothetical protein